MNWSHQSGASQSLRPIDGCCLEARKQNREGECRGHAEAHVSKRQGVATCQL